MLKVVEFLFFFLGSKFKVRVLVGFKGSGRVVGKMLHSYRDKMMFWCRVMAITQHHRVEKAPGSLEMIPINFPVLPKPSRTPGRY